MVTCCDAECAGVNHCRIGGFKCEACGGWFCGDEMSGGYENLCAECGARRLEEDGVREEDDDGLSED